jgi:hypothetical protein
MSRSLRRGVAITGPDREGAIILADTVSLKSPAIYEEC